MGPSKVQKVRLSFWQQLQQCGWKHWCWVFILTAVGFASARYLGKHNLLVDLRYKLYNATMALSRPHGALYPLRTAVVFIGDDEYWSEPLAGRAPLKRDYLAALIGKIEQFRPASIAVDFDLRSPHPDGGPLDFPDYRDETKALTTEVAHISGHTPIVLPVTVAFDPHGDYVRQPTVFDADIRCDANVHCGYIQLPYDLRRVPLSLELSNGITLDSFSGAVIRTIDEEAFRRVEESGKDALPFVSYLSEEEFRNSKHVVSASEVMHGSPEQLRTALANRAVFIGADWRTNASHSGGRIDLHAAPPGTMPGAMLHANYVEAVLGQRTYRPLSELVVESLEVMLVLGLSIVWALDTAVTLKAVATFCALVGSFLVTYVLIQNLGVFLDFAIPLLVVGTHLGIDKILEWRQHGIAHQAVA